MDEKGLPTYRLRDTVTLLSDPKAGEGVIVYHDKVHELYEVQWAGGLVSNHPYHELRVAQK